MKNWIILALVTIALFSCRKEVHLDCIEEVIATNNLRPYTGQELGCNFFMGQYDLNGEQYFALNSPCANMIITPFNCTGDTLCLIRESPACNYFWENITFVGIIGFQE